MALQLGAIREALLEAGASPEKATKAAEELAGYESRLAGIEMKLSVLTAMVGFLTLLALGNLWLSFTIVSRLP